MIGLTHAQQHLVGLMQHLIGLTGLPRGQSRLGRPSGGGGRAL